MLGGADRLTAICILHSGLAFKTVSVGGVLTERSLPAETLCRECFRGPYARGSGGSIASLGRDSAVDPSRDRNHVMRLGRGVTADGPLVYGKPCPVGGYVVRRLDTPPYQTMVTAGHVYVDRDMIYESLAKQADR